MDLLAVADALKAIAADVDGVEVAAIGINAAWPTTPAVEVIPAGFDLRTLAAGALSQLVTGTVFLAVYVALTANLEDDERTLIPIVTGLLSALNDPDLDRTLGGLVEDVRPVRVDLDVVKRNGRTYRSALIELALGDLEDNV